jgi:hypothetical protein
VIGPATASLRASALDQAVGDEIAQDAVLALEGELRVRSRARAAGAQSGRRWSDRSAFTTRATKGRFAINCCHYRKSEPATGLEELDILRRDD